MKLCPRHRDESVVATVEQNGERLCAPCAAKDRVLALNVPALRTRELGARQLVRIALALLLLVCATAAALEPTNGAREGESLDARIERLRCEIEERQVALRLSIAERRVRRSR